MSAMSRLALLAVVFVDLMGQGLLFPIISELVMSTKFHFLPSDTPQPTRHLFYGIVISSFFLAWFWGLYMSRSYPTASDARVQWCSVWLVHWQATPSRL